MPSERQKKRVIADGVRALKLKPGWDPAGFQSIGRSDQLRQGIEASRVTQALSDADTCAECLRAREQGDPTALCGAHLRKAMGI